MQNYMNPYAPMQGMSQPPYQGYNQPINNPYMERMNQLQNYQQSLQMQPSQMSGANQQQPIGLNCRIIDDFNMIVANDVPMDGNGAIFMKRDGSEMQWRNWSANGTIVTTSYLPVIDQKPDEGTNIPQNDFTALNEDVKALREDIKDMRSMIEKSMSGSVAKTTTSRTKKVEDDNE